MPLLLLDRQSCRLELRWLHGFRVTPYSRILGRRAHRELIRIAFSDEYCPAIPQPLDHSCVDMETGTLPEFWTRRWSEHPS